MRSRPRSVLLRRDLPRQRMPVRSGHRGMQSSVRLLHDETKLPALAIGWQTEVGKRLVGTVIPGSDLQDLTCLVASCDLAPEFVRDPNDLLDLLDRGHALALAVPEVVLDSNADVNTEGDCHRPELRYRPPQRFDRHHRPVR